MKDLLRVAIFTDGNFLYHVSNYYRYNHPLGIRLSIPGLKEFIRDKISKFEGVDIDLVKIVRAEYYRGRLAATEAANRNSLLSDRKFEDVLAYAGITPVHFQLGKNGTEKGVDTSLALNAFYAANNEGVDIVVLIAGDSDYVPLITMLNKIGKRSFVIGCNFSFFDRENKEHKTQTSGKLLQDSTYSLDLNTVIEEGSFNAKIFM